MPEGFASGLFEGMQGMRQERTAQLNNMYQAEQINKMRMENTMQRQFLSQMNQLGQGEGQPMDSSERLDALGNLQLKSGMVNQGAKTLEAASQLRAKNAAIATAQAREAEYRMNVVKSNSQLMGSLMAGVTDENSWRRAQTMYAAQTGMMSPYSQMPYSKDLVEQVRNQSMSAYQQADLSMKAARLKRQEQLDKLLDTKRRLEISKMEREAVDGGKGTAKTGTRTPPKQLVSLAQNQIASNFNILSSDEQSLLSERVAEDTMELMQRNPALKTSEAMAQAYLNRLNAGDFKNYTPMKKMESKEMPALPPGFVLGEPGEGGSEDDSESGEE